MQQQLHKNNTLCHVELVIPTEVEGSQNTTNHVTSSLSRSRQLIPKSHSIFYVLFSILYSLFSIPTTAQQYDWEWAINGGGSLGETGWYYQVEQVFDIQVGSDNNYYFVAKIKNGTPQLGGQPVTVYGNQLGGNDIFIFSTTCDGTVRWSQAIGGGGYLMQPIISH